MVWYLYMQLTFNYQCRVIDFQACVSSIMCVEVDLGEHMGLYPPESELFCHPPCLCFVCMFPVLSEPRVYTSFINHNDKIVSICYRSCASVM